MGEQLSDDERKHLYGSLLRGIANEAQDRLCAADKHHAWGEWRRYVIEPDMPKHLSPNDGTTPISDEIYRVAARRQCKNCGKEQLDG